MTILYEYTVGTGSTAWLTVLFWIFSAAIFIAATSLAIGNENPKYLLLYFLVILSIFVGFRVSSDDRYQVVKVTINDTIPYVEVAEHYEYISREGDIWTFKVLEDNKGE